MTYKHFEIGHPEEYVKLAKTYEKHKMKNKAREYWRLAALNWEKIGESEQEVSPWMHDCWKKAAQAYKKIGMKKEADKMIKLIKKYFTTKGKLK